MTAAEWAARLVDLAGTQLLQFGDDQPIAMPELTIGWPEPRDSSIPAPGRSGTLDSTTQHGAAAITAELVIRDGAGVSKDVWLTRLRGYMHPGRRAWLYISRTGWPEERRVLVRGATAPVTFNWVPSYNLTVGWVAVDGVLESAVEQSVTLYPTGSAEGGYSFPKTYPKTYAAGNVPGATYVTNGGTVDALPYVDIYGACGNAGTVKNLTSGERFGFVGMPVAQGEFLRVDMRQRLVLLSNDIGQSRYAQVDFASAVWWALKPGPNLIAFVPGTPGATCQAVIRWRDTTI